MNGQKSDGLFYYNRRMKYIEQRGKFRGFLYYRTEDGKRRAKTKDLEADRPRAARAEFDKWFNEEEAAAQRSLQRSGRALTLSETPVPDYVSRYIDLREASKTIEESTVTGYRTSLRYIRERFANKAIKELTASDVSEWVSDLTQRGLSSSTVGKAYRLLKMVLNDAIKYGAIERNPANSVKPPKRRNKNEGKNALDASERKRLLNALDNMEPCPLTVAAYISLFTGVRRGEICALQWRDLDAANSVLWVKRALGEGAHGVYVKLPKTDKPRDVVLPKSLFSILMRWKEIQRQAFAADGVSFREDAYIIGDPLGYCAPGRITKEWATLARLLKLRGIEGRQPVFHDLRHTWATVYISSGGDANTAASNLGHAKPSMTLDVYASADPDAKRRAAVITEQAMRQAG